jgi:hypothetical protein
MFILAEEMRLLKVSGNFFGRSLMTFALLGLTSDAMQPGTIALTIQGNIFRTPCSDAS